MNLNSGCFALDRRDHRRPVVVGGPGSCAGPPGALEDVVQHEHGHVAADAVALFGNLRDRLDHRLPEPGLKGVELEHIRPRREVRVPAAGEHLPPNSMKDAGSFFSILSAPLNEVLGMIADPGVVRRHVVGNEVEDQPQSALAEHASRGGKSLRPAEMFVNDVAAHAVGRADIVLRAQSRGGPS